MFELFWNAPDIAAERDESSLTGMVNQSSRNLDLRGIYTHLSAYDQITLPPMPDDQAVLPVGHRKG